MERLYPPPSSLPWRTFVTCTVAAVALLLATGSPWKDAVRLLLGILPISADDQGLFRVLLEPVCFSFALISSALILGLCCALAATVLFSALGRNVTRSLGWLGSALAGVPPMAWALGAVWLLIHCWNLPVESLFPYQPRPDLDTIQMKSGRAVWSFLVPVLVLAIPVFATALFSLTQQVSTLWSTTASIAYRCRGLSRRQVYYGHLLPQLSAALLWIARPSLMMLMAFSIPVEQILGCDGWGAFTAQALQAKDARGLAAAIYTSGLMLMVWHTLLALRERPRLSVAIVKSFRGGHHRSFLCAFLGIALAVWLCLPPEQTGLPPALLSDARVDVRHEVLLVLLYAAGVTLLIAAGVWLRCLFRAWSFMPKRGVFETTGSAPLLFCILAAMPFIPRIEVTLALLGLAAAHPSFISIRNLLRGILQSSDTLASRMIGVPRLRFARNHVLPLLRNDIARSFFQIAATTLLWLSLLTYYGLQIPHTNATGAKLAVGADQILDAPAPALLPAVWLALWGLSFQWLSRIWHTGLPPYKLPNAEKIRLI